MNSSVNRELRRRALKSSGILVFFTLAMLAVSWISVTSGVAGFSSIELLATLLPPGWLPARTLDYGEWVIFSGIRLPRVIIAIIAGAGLALCGAVMQIITRNPMASPFTTGISNAAAFGAGIAIFFGLTIAGSQGAAITLCAFVAAAACSIVVVSISAGARRSATALILAGIALSYLFSALTSGLQYVANEQKLGPILYWAFGDLGRATWQHIGYLTAIVTIGLAYVLINGGKLARLALGDEAALALGTPVRRIRVESGIWVTVISASIISVTGVIGFVGLVAPHLASMIIGHDERVRMPLTALIGGLLLLLADLAGRTVVSPVIIPVGIMVSLVGVPMFLWLILRENRKELR
ncbi:FecCD family ABC transporter permease [Corynebacterium hindlerae]|uniref:FecCD family ABC transporter permease n=1 Tax=Corynebacterium hindlerae TaxID=699041 RepID=UPI003AB0AE72